MNGKEAAAGFLERHHMDAAGIEREAALKKLLAEMAEALDGQSRSLKMIPYYLGQVHSPKEEICVTVIDIGGTNVRSAVVRIGPEGTCEFEDRRSFLRPGASGPLNTAAFFGEIAGQMKGQLNMDRIGICFSLATIPQPDRDAIMVAGGKQIQITDMLGKKVGACFRDAMRRQGLPAGQQITVVNDTVAAALGGVSFGSADADTKHIGFIYGTGMNICYQEPGGHTINTEMGAYTGFPAGDLDDAYDATLIDIGQDRFEKMVSGGYQGGLVRTVLRCASKEGLLSAETARRLKNLKDLQSPDISAFCLAPAGDGKIASVCTSVPDREFLLELFDGLTERSALLCSIALTASMLRSHGINSPTENRDRFFITAEGSTYQKQPGFSMKLEKQLTSLASEKYGLRYRIGVIPDAVLRGIAAACLSG